MNGMLLTVSVRRSVLGPASMRTGLLIARRRYPNESGVIAAVAGLSRDGERLVRRGCDLVFNL